MTFFGYSCNQILSILHSNVCSDNFLTNNRNKYTPEIPFQAYVYFVFVFFVEIPS